MPVQNEALEHRGGEPQFLANQVLLSEKGRGEIEGGEYQVL